MSIKSSFPTDSPSLVLDFANSRRLDPRITFTRAATGNVASYMGPDGLVKFAGPNAPRFDHRYVPRINLFDNSDQMDTNLSSWIKGGNTTRIGTTTAPDGSNNAYIYQGDGSSGNEFVAQQKNLLANTTYTVSVYAKLISGSVPTGGTIISASYNNGSTVVRSTVSLNGNLTTSWQRFTTTFTNVTAVSGYGMYFAADQNNTAQIALWGAQIEIAGSASEYNAENSSDKIESLGLLIEESRTNSFGTSDFSSGWTDGVDASLSFQSSVVGPDGQSGVYKLVEDTSDGTHIIYRNQTVITNQPYVFSIFAKKAERKYVYLYSFNALGDGETSTFNLETGTISASSGTGNTPFIQEYPNGWYRVGMVLTNNTDTSSTISIRMKDDSENSSYQGDGVSGYYVWGVQLEEGTFPTSYIPTSGSAVTRNADYPSIGGVNFTGFYNQKEGTFVFQGENNKFTASNFGRYFQTTPGDLNKYGPSVWIDPNTTNEYFRFRIDNSNNVPVFLDNYYLSQTPPPDEKVFGAFAYADGDYAICGNGEVPLTSNNSDPHRKDITKLFIGTAYGNDASHLNGTLKKIIYFPMRLSNAQLQSLTK